MPIKKLLVLFSVFLTPLAFIFGLIAVLTIYIPNTPSRHYTSTIVYAASPSDAEGVLGATVSSIQEEKTESVRNFLARYNSPLESYAPDIIQAADEYGLDYRLIPAISMKESGGCKKIPLNSYNCWGFGIYGTTVTRFEDYREGIFTVTKALATRYRDRGLVTPEQIMTMYTPSSNGSWARDVNHFMGQMQ